MKIAALDVFNAKRLLITVSPVLLATPRMEIDAVTLPLDNSTRPGPILARVSLPHPSLSCEL